VLVQADERSIEAEGGQLYWANVHEDAGKVTTGGSRTCAILAKAPTIAQAEEQCERALRHVKGEGLRVRHDIGKTELLRRRVDHMQRILHQQGSRN